MWQKFIYCYCLGFAIIISGYSLVYSIPIGISGADQCYEMPVNGELIVEHGAGPLYIPDCNAHLPVTWEWSVTGGTILEGQGTWRIRVKYTTKGIKTVSCTMGPWIPDPAFPGEHPGDHSGGSKSVSYIVYKLWIQGDTPIGRGETGTYEVKQEGGINIEHNIWSSSQTNLNHPGTSWSGIMVIDTDISTDIVPMCSYHENEHAPIKTLSVNIVPRCWVTPEGVVEDTDSNWGVFPGNVDAGEIVNIHDATKDNKIYPFNVNLEEGYTPAEIADSGPNHGKWFIQSTEFETIAQTHINKWMKPGQINPPNPPNELWYEHNTSRGYPVAAHLVGIKRHEAKGKFSEIGYDGLLTGHHGRVKWVSESTTSYNIRKVIEDNVANSLEELKQLTNEDYQVVENKLHDFSHDLDTNPNSIPGYPNWQGRHESWYSIDGVFDWRGADIEHKH